MSLSDQGDLRPIRRALLSVSDKAGLLDLARGLAARGVALVSTGNSAGMLREAGLEVAEVIAVAVANADAHWQLGEQARNMRIAMDSRAVIEQAKGVLMAQQQVDAEQAFEILRAASQRSNRKLRDIAVGVVASTQPGG